MKFMSAPIIAIAFLTAFLFQGRCLGENRFPFEGEVTGDNINIRTDSTANSQVICAVKNGGRLKVASELYEWYKVCLPPQAPSYIRKDLIQEETVSGERVNVRLEPNQNSAIVGKANKGDPVTIISEQSGWYKIKPLKNSFGWIHKKFVIEAAVSAPEEAEAIIPPEEEIEKPEADAALQLPKEIILQGIIKPKFITRAASHKLITRDKDVFLIRGDSKVLNQFNHRQVKINGHELDSSGLQYPLIAALVIELLD